MPTTSQLMGVGMPPELAKLLGGTAHAVQSEVDMRTALLAGQPIVISSPITLTSNLAITTQVIFLQGGRIITNGYTCTITGALSAGAYQIFTTSGYEIVLGPSSTLYVLLEWFGAVGDGDTTATDDTAAIQLACNIASRPATNVIPVQPLNKTYSISTITCPRGLTMRTPYPKRSYAIFKARAATVMFIVTDMADSFVSFEGICLDGNALATVGISVLDANNVYIDRCSWKGAGGKGISIDGGIFIHITNCEWVGSHASDSIIYITGQSIAVYIQDNNFSSPSCNYCVYADGDWIGDSITISDCTMGSLLNIAAIRFTNNASNGCAKSVIRNVRIDQHASLAHIVLDQYAWSVDISGCTIVDSAPYNILCDAGYVSIHDNWLADSTTAAIGLTTNSNFCVVGACNIINVAKPLVIDTSLYQGAYHFNRIERLVQKGTTANRTLGVYGGYGAYEFGVMYLDTTLDADGKPIWWNGTAWVDATGAVV